MFPRFPFLLVAAALLTTAGLFAQPAPVPPENPFEDALARAPVERRFVLVDFFSYSSPDSQIMSTIIRQNTQVKAALAERYIVVHAEVEYRRELAVKFNVTRTPTIAILTPDGHELDRFEGGLGQAELIKLLKEITDGNSAFARLKAQAAATTLKVADRIDLAVEYVRRGAYTEAVENYSQAAELCLDSKDNARYLKSVVVRMAALANRSPVNGELVRALRDKLEAKVMGGDETYVSLIVDINQRLNERERNVALFLRIPPFSPLRKQILPQVLPELVAARQYSAVVLTADLETLVGGFYSAPSAHGTPAQAPVSARAAAAALLRPAPVDLRAQRLADVVVTSTEALLGTGQRRKAERIAGRAMENSTIPLRARLVEAATRVGGEDAGDFVKWLDREYPAEAAPRSLPPI